MLGRSEISSHTHRESTADSIVHLQTGSVQISKKQSLVEQRGESFEEITAIQIKGEKGTADILDLIEKSKIRVLLRRIRKPDCATDKKSYIRANWVETELDIVAILHEIGHIKQTSDPKTKEVFELEEKTKRISAVEPWQRIEPYIHKILALFPEKADLLGLDPQIQTLLVELKQHEWSRFRQDEILSLLNITKNEQEATHLTEEYERLLEVPLNQNRMIELRLELAPFFQRVQSVLHIPENEMEKDATRRAFRWMREIKERTGVDLFAVLKIKNYQRIAPKKGVDLDEEQAISAIQDLADALCTYSDRSKAN